MSSTEPPEHSDDSIRAMRDEAIERIKSLENSDDPLAGTYVTVNNIIISEANRVLANRAARAAREAKRKRRWGWLDKF